ncbi:hypothetical protein MMC26_005563 [Xylographa opegraphella]|nr:hypothetical protein [Xylographa opegraphella]
MADVDEKLRSFSENEDVAGTPPVTTPKLDQHGFPLRPQPSDDPKDPLNWNRWLKLFTLLQVSFLAFLGPFTQAYINSAYAPLAASLHITIVEASYQTTIAIVLAGVSPILWSPISNVYGRRPIFIFISAIGIVAHAAAGAAQSWGGILAARAFVGIGTSAGMGIGAAVVADMYFMHERGTYMGIYTVFVTNGAHVAAVAGGFTAKNIGWRWCYWIPAIVVAANWLINLFCLPETLYHRNPLTGQTLQPSRSWFQLFNFTGVHVQRRLRLWDITHVFVMLKYPSVVLPTVYYSISFGLGSVLFAVTGSAAFGSIYHFNTAQVGMAIGLSTFVGTLLGELLAGPVSDRVLYLYTKSHAGVPKPEARLQATWPGLVILPAGVIIEGVCFQYKTHWSGPVMGMGIAAFGLQIVQTNIFAYMTDCYKPQSAEISTLLNFGRQTFSFTLGFYMIPFATATTYGVAWSVLAVLDAVLYLGIVLLMWRGREWRERMGPPNFDRDI